MKTDTSDHAHGPTTLFDVIKSIGEHHRTPEKLQKCQLLIEKNKLELNLQDEDGRTPLMNAVSLGQEDLVKLLINAGADVQMTDHQGNTAFSILINETHRWKMVSIKEGTEFRQEWSHIGQLLITNGAEIHLENHRGEMVNAETILKEQVFSIEQKAHFEKMLLEQTENV